MLKSNYSDKQNHFALLKFNFNIKGTPSLTQSEEARYIETAPKAWSRSNFGLYAKANLCSLKSLLTIFWSFKLNIRIKLNHSKLKSSLITLSRGPNARKKQSREQLSSQDSIFRLRLTTPVNSKVDYKFINPLVSFLALSSTPSFLSLFQSNLHAPTRMSKFVKFKSISLFLLK